ncbi:MAG: 16S rRNA (uracil(1498)-N(3))-methyltransferase [Gammaproteobacteria bacterium]|nr:MAG: 16S rRNA (uracil(1498)-N(3))-methyltransferase [Gammaproteobacteria bacterium]RLA24563.1 MAG: 16S rRNA (uracil(1498)-N(3))-methyltransferase [Gammaproteobacteria bacterium]
MRISRLFLREELKTNLFITLNNDSAHYLRSVLRLKAGSEIRVFNGSGGEFAASLMDVSRKVVVVKIGEWFDKKSEPKLNITLGLAISRGERMDIAIQKAVELGVSSIIPIITEYCAVSVRNERMVKKESHWQKIAQGASEQSGRTVVPDVGEIVRMDQWLENKEEALKLFLDPRAKQSLQQAELVEQTIILLSGPEGGFSESEQRKAVQAGYQSVTLGPRILRAETACIAAITAVQLLWGDL